MLLPFALGSRCIWAFAVVGGLEAIGGAYWLDVWRFLLIYFLELSFGLDFSGYLGGSAVWPLVRRYPWLQLLGVLRSQLIKDFLDISWVVWPRYPGTLVGF